MKFLRLRRKVISSLMVILTLYWQVAHPLHAATLYWDGSASGSWNAVGNWSTIIGGGSDPAAVAGVNDDVIFNATTVGSQIATLDAAQSVRSLTFSSNATSPITLAAGTAGTLALGSGGITLQSGSAAVTISAPISLTAAQTWTNDSSSLLTISGAITGYSATNTLTFDGSGNMTISGLTAAVSTTLTKNGAGTVTIGGADPNFTGTVVVNSGVLDFTTNTSDFTTATINDGGTLRARSGSNVLSDSLVMTINSGGIYDIQASDTIAAILGAGTVSAGAAATLTISNTTDRVFDGVLTNGAGTLTFSKNGTNTVTLTNNSTYTGTTTVNTGRLVLSGANGRLSGSTTINVGDNNGAGDVLQLGATGGADTISGTLDRIADGATITLSGGVLDLQGPSAASTGTTETIATLAIGASGNSVITLTAATGGTVQLSATSMTRAANGGTALVRGTALGGTGADTARLVLATAPTGNNFIGTSTTAGDKNLRIIPWLVGDNTTTGAGSGFVTHDATNGLRTLAAGEYGTAITGNANNNISNAGGETFSVAGSNFSVNSMLMTAGTTTVNGGTSSPQNYLTVASGALLFTGNATLAGTGRLNFGGIQGIIRSAANTTAIAGVINNVITGTAGLTLGSSGDVSNTVALGGANLFTGGVRITSGVLRLDHGNALGGLRSLNAVTVDTAGTLSLNGQSAAVGTLIGVAGSVVNNGHATTAGRLRFHQTADQNFTGTFVNGGAAALNIIKTGNSTLTLNAGNSTFTGALVIQQGAMTLSGNAGRVSGATSLSIGGGGTLRLSNSNGSNNQGDRLISTAVTLRGGTFDYDNNAAGSTSYAETIGALTLAAGANTVIVDRATSGRTTLLTSASLARTLGAVVTFGSQSNGATNNTFLGLDAQDRLLFTAIPALNDGILGGWALGNGGADFATYWNGGTAATRSVGYLGQATTLVTPAGSQLYSTDLSQASWTTSTNVFLSTAGATLTAGRTVNSLKIASPNAVDLGGFTLNVDAGGILYAGGTAGIFIGISNGSLTTQGGATASPDLVFHLNNATDVITASANIINNGANAVGLTKSGGGTLIVSGTNTYTGPTAVVGGTLNIDSDARLGTAPGTAAAGHLKLYNGSTLNTTDGFELNASRLIELGGGGTITLNATGNLIYNGTITSPIPTGSDIPDVTNLTLTGDIDMTLAGNSTIGGSWVISGGTGAESLITLGGSSNYIGGGLVIGRGNNARAKVVYGGSGPLTVGSLDPTGFNIDIGHGNVAGTGTTMGELDLSGMTGTFTATVANLRIGFETIASHSALQGTLRLGASSNITASTAVLLAHSPNSGTTTAHIIQYGSGTHTLTTPLITLGSQKGTNVGNGLFLQSGANLSIAGFGPAASELRIAYNNVATGTIGAATLDATLGVLKGDFSTITVGFKSSTNTGGANGTFLVGADAENSILATTLLVGDQRGTEGTTTPGATGATGTFTVGGGTVGISGNVTIGNNQSTGNRRHTATGTWNLNGGTSTVGGVLTVASATVSGTNAHASTGTLNVAGGDLSVGGNLVIGSTVSNIAVANTSNGTVNISHAASAVTVAGDILLGNVDSSVVNPISTGTLVLTNGSLTVTGNIGRSLLNGAEASQSRGFINVAGGALDMTDGTILAKALAFRSGSIINVATGGITLDAESTTSTTTITGLTGDALILRDVNLTANVALTGATASNVHYENAGAGAGGTLSGNLDLGTAARTFNIEDIVANAEDLTVSGIISNSGEIIKTGAGTLRLSGANTFTGSVTVNSGELKAGHNQGFGNANNAYSIATGAFLSVGGFSNTIGALTGTGAVQNGTAGAGTLVVGGGNASSSFAGTVQDGAGGGVLNLTKTGTGTVNLTGAANLTYTGTTTVNGGILNAGIRGSLGITITGGTLNFADGTANTLTLGSSGNVLQLSGGAVLGFELGATGDKIVLASGGLGLTTGSITLDLYGIAGLAAGTYDLIDAASGGLLDTNGSTGAYILGNQPSGFTYNLIQSDTLVQVIVAAFTGKYWRGDVDGSWLTDNAGDTNFSSDAGGLAEAGAIPGAADSVLFSASTATGPVIATTLDANFTVKEIIFLSQPMGVTGVTIAPGGAFALTITPTDAATQGVTLNAGAGNVVISAPVVIGADQTWKVVNAVGTSLTVSGNLTGTNGVTKTNTGALTLSGDNSGYSGVLTLNGGILNLNSATALGSGNFVITTGTFDNTTGSALTLTTNNPQAWNGDLSFGGANNLTFGTGAITLGGNRTVTTNGAGILAQQGDIGGAFSLTKGGVGVLVLAGNASNYSGGSIVNTGTLSGVVTGASGTPLGSGDVTLNAGALALRGDGTGSSGTIAVGNNLVVGGSAAVDVDRLTVNTGNTFALGTLSIGTSTLTVNSANSYGLSFTAGTLSGNATISHTAGIVTIGGAVGEDSGARSLTKSGAGTLVLNGDSTFSGGVIQTAGAINLGHAAGLGLGTYNVTGASTLMPTATLSIGNAIVLDAGLTITGTESLTLAGAITNSTASQTLTNNLDLADTLTLTGTVNLSETNTARTLIISGTGNTVQSSTSVIQNGGTAAGILDKSGTGTLTLNGDNIYTGETILRQGTLILGHRDSLGGTTARLQTATNSNSVIQANADLTGANALPNAFLLNVGTTIVSGTNSIQFTGTTTNNSGNRSLNNSMTGGATLTLGTVNLSNDNTGRTMTFTGAGTTTVGVIANGGTGAGNLVKSGTGTLIVTGTSSFTGASTVNNGVLQIGNGGTGGNLNTSTGINLVAATSILRFNRSNAFTSHTVAISGAGAVEQVGAGVTTVTGANTYTGTTSISGGGLRIGNNGAAGTLGSGDVILSNGSTLTFNRTDAQTIANNITGTGNVTKTSTGAFTLTPGTANTFEGTITVLNSSLIAGNDSAFGNSGNNIVITATGAGITATLELNGNNYTSGTVTLGGTTATSLPRITTGVGTLTLGGDVTYSATTNPLGALITGNLDLGTASRVFNVGDSTSAATDLDLQVLLSGSGFVAVGDSEAGETGGIGFTKTGNGTLSLGGSEANTYTGTTTVNGGTLVLAKGAGLLVIGGDLVIGDGTGSDLVRLTSHDQIAGTSLVSFNGTGANAGILQLNGQNQTLGGLSSTGGAGIVENGAVGLSTLTLNVASGTHDFSGVIQNGNAGTLTLIKSGSGTQILSGENSFTDGVTINDGSLEVGSAGALGSSGTISFGGGALRFSSGNTTDYSARFSTVAAQPVKIDTNGQTVSFASALSSAGGALEKTGLGSLVLSAVNTYTGATAVNEGNLFVNGSLDAASTVSVANGATLGGTGNIPGTVNVTNGGIIEAGHLGTGTLTIGTLNLGAAATNTSIINLSNIATGNPGILDLTALNVITNPGTITINISNAIAVATGTYKLIDYTGIALTTPQFSAFTLGTTTGFNSRQNLSLFNNTALTQIELAMTGDAPKWTGALSSEWSAATLGTPKNWVLITGATATDFLSGDQVLFDDTASGSYVVDISNGNVDPASIEFNNSNGAGKTYTLQGTNGITGTTVLTKNNTGTLIINNANSFTGGVVLNNGVIQLGNANALGTGNLLTFGAAAPAGTELQLNGNNATVAGLVSAGSNAVVENGTSASTNATLTVNLASGSNSFAGVLQNGGTDTLALSQTGSGTLILTGTNTYTGGTSVGTGSTLQVGDGGAGGSIAGNAMVDGALSFNRTGMVAYGGMVGGTGSLSIVAGTLDFTGTVNNTLAGTSISSGATLQIGNGTTGGTVSSNIANAGTLTINLPAAGSTLLSGNITGAGALTTTGGNGTTILTGANTYNGATTIGTGTILQVGNGGTAGAIGTGTVTVDGTLRFSRTDALVVSVPLAGNGGVNIASGSITYTGANTYSGATTVDSGATLSIGQGGVLGSVTGTGGIVTNGSVVFNRGDAITYDGVISGAGTITKSGNGVTTFAGTNTYSGSTTIGGGTLSISDSNNLGDASATNTIAISNGAILQNTGATVDLGSNRTVTIGTGGAVLDVTDANVLTVSGVVSGSSLLTKTGTGILTLSGANTHSAGTTLSAGTLNIGHLSALGTGTFTIAGGTFDNMTGSAGTLAGNIAQAWNGNFTFVGTHDLNLGTGGVNLSADRTVTVTSGTLTVGGIIGDTAGDFGLIKVGAGTLHLKGVNTFGADDNVTIQGGTLIVDGAAGLGAATNNVIFNTAAGTLRFTDNASFGAGQYFRAAGVAATIEVDANKLVEIAGGPTSSATNGFNTNGGTNGPGASVIKTGVGTLRLSGGNGFFDGDGGWVVTQGTLSIAGSNTAVLGDATPATVALRLNGGTVSYDTDTTNIVNAAIGTILQANSTVVSNVATAGAGISQRLNALTVSAGGLTLNVQGGSNVTSGTAGITTGVVTLNGNVTFNITDPTGGGTTLLTLGAVTGGSNSITLTGNGDFSQTGALASTAATSFTLNSGYSGTATLSQANTYTGSTVVNGGKLSISNENNLGANPGASTADQLTLNGGTLLTTTNLTIDDSNRGITVGASGGTIETSTSTTATVANIINGVGSLAKTGNGRLVLIAANTYAGTTMISAGTLEVNNTTGSGTGSGAVNVSNTGSKLSGSGSINGSTIIGSGAILAPGVGDTDTSGRTLTFTAAGTAVEVQNGGQIQLSLNSSTQIDAGFDWTMDTALAYLDANGGTAGVPYMSIWGVAGSTYDSIALTNGTFTLGDTTGGTVRLINSSSYTIGTIFKLLDWSGLGSGTLLDGGGFNVNSTDNLDFSTALEAGLAWDTSALTTYGVVVVVPEPSRTLLLMLGLLCLMRCRRRGR